MGAQPEISVDLQALTDAVILQRQERMIDSGPSLRGIGSAHFQHSGTLLYVGGITAKPGKEQEMVARVIRYAISHWMTISWTVIAEREDHAIAKALQQAGFSVYESLRMMGRIGPLVEPQHHLSDIAVKPVTSIEEMQEYERISAWGFNNQTNVSREYLSLRARERWHEQQSQWYQYYAGKIQDIIISGAYVSLWERVPTIYGVVTAPTARNRGVAGQVMVRLVEDTLTRGFPWTCLYVAVGNPAEQLYRNLGYTPLLHLTTYQLSPVNYS